MSEMDTAPASANGSGGGDAAPSSPAPQTTAEIASQVIDGLEGAETDAPAPTSDPALTPPIGDRPQIAATRDAETAAPAELSPAASFLLKEGHALKKVDGRATWLPATTVERMLDKYLTTHKTTWDGERTPLESKLKEYEADRQEMYADITGDPAVFLQKLARHDPRYSRYVTDAAPGRPAPPVEAPIPEMPPPDLPLSDGTTTYSLDGVKTKLIPWLTQAITASIKKDLAAEREQERTTATQREQATQARTQKVNQMMAEAQTWPLFGPIAANGELSPFQKDVMTVFMADKSLSLHSAYMKVAGPRFTETDAQQRERILKELNGAPRGTAIPRTATDAPRPAGPLSTAEIAARTIDRLERSGGR